MVVARSKSVVKLSLIKCFRALLVEETKTMQEIIAGM